MSDTLQCPDHGLYITTVESALCPQCVVRGWGRVHTSSGFSRKDRWWTKPEWLAYAVMKVWVAAWVTFIGLWLLVHGGHP